MTDKRLKKDLLSQDKKKTASARKQKLSSKSVRHKKRRLYKQKRSRKQRKKKRHHFSVKLLRDLWFSTIFSLLLLYVISLFTFSLPKVSGYSMTPLLEDNDRIFVSKLGKSERFSLVYFRVPGRKGEFAVRRIIGLPGEEIRYVQDELLINGESKTEYFLAEALQQARKGSYLLTEDFSLKDIKGVEQGRIPQKKYLVLGDNRSFSTDSRYYGLIDEKDIIGVVSMKLLPLHEMMRL